MGLSHRYKNYDPDPCEKCNKDPGMTVVNNLLVCNKCAKKLKKQLKKGEINDCISTCDLSDQ